MHVVDPLEIGLFLFIERFLCTRDGSRRNHIDETIGVVIDKADALLGCFWSYQHDDTHVVFIGNGFNNILIVLEGQVGDDGSTDTTFHTTLAKCFNAIVHDGIEITHQYERDFYFLFNLLKL